MTKLTTPEFWNKAYEHIQFTKLPSDNPIRKWMEAYIPATTIPKSAFEIGCYPGKYIEILGNLGYSLNGLDFNEHLESLKSWLQSLGYEVGSLEQKDFFQFNSQQQFDLVCSFGFIEHFSNWEEVLQSHMKLIRKDGYLVIEVPNFRGPFQYLLHRLLDHENLKGHHLPSMNAAKWKKLAKKEGFDIVFCGYLEKFHFWHNNTKPNRWQSKAFKLIQQYSPKINSLIPKPNSITSPYIGLIAKKH